MTDQPPHTARAAVALLVVCLGTVAAPLDTAVNIAFPGIAAGFGRNVADISWVVIAYVLTYASLLLVFGRLGDLVGYRAVFRIGLVAFAAGLGLCAVASDFHVLLAGRFLQGIGAALVLSCGPALATSLYGEHERTRILGIYAAMTALGGALGPLLGGLLLDAAGWQAMFWARIPLLVAALLLSGHIPKRPGSGTAFGIDPVGSLQLIVAMWALLLGLSLRDGALGTPERLGLVVLGALLLVAFISRQSRRAQPIIRPALFLDRNFAWLNAASVLANGAAFAVVLIGPFYLLGVARLSPWLAGLVLALGGLGIFTGSSLAAGCVSLMGRMPAAALALGMSAAGMLGVAALSPGTPVPLMVLPLIVQGVGLGLFQVAYADHVTDTLPLSERGVAGSLTMLTRTVGIIAGATLHAALHQQVQAEAIAAGAVGSAAFMAGFQAVFMASAAALAAALLLAGLWVSLARMRT